jgi:hypothetical protein
VPPIARTTPTLGKNSVRSASTIPVGTSTLWTGKRATAHQTSPNAMTGARRQAQTAVRPARSRSRSPVVWAGPQAVWPTISLGL